MIMRRRDFWKFCDSVKRIREELRETESRNLEKNSPKELRRAKRDLPRSRLNDPFIIMRVLAPWIWITTGWMTVMLVQQKGFQLEVCGHYGIGSDAGSATKFGRRQ
ncbi:hypothetical protein VNO77_06794 [Canavalia gladiata]|uniref:Uncharacterized protein n=1 Tax=Canavalia gladiata TaxID=3824 RepID=A0AAN9QVT5_CANGL